jgi:hypothetical protein
MTKITIEIERYELSALIEFHREAEIEASHKREYMDAETHKRRREELAEIWNSPEAQHG